MIYKTILTKAKEVMHMFEKSKKEGGLGVRYLGQQVNKAPVMPVPVLNEKLKPKGKEIAPNAKN